MSLRTLIVDDERLARQRLRRLLGAHPEVEIVGECVDGAAAIASAQEMKPDLLLLDIQMPGLDGFDVIEAIEEDVTPIIIFVTAFDQHALRAFDSCALDYLLKPVSPDRLRRGIDRALSQRATMPDSRSTPAAAPSNARFHVRSGQRTSFISPDEIDWIEADGNYAILHVGGQNHLLRATMSALESDLPETFARTSRSSIVNLGRVKELQTVGGSHFAVMQDEARVPVTGSIRALQERLRSL